MTTKLMLRDVNIVDLVMAVVFVCVLWRKRKVSDFRFFTAYLASWIPASLVSIPLLFFRKYTGLDLNAAWKTYWGTYYAFFIVQVALQTLATYEIYRLAMRPLPGLQRIGQVIFRWVAGVSFGLSVLFAISPHGSDDYWGILIEQIHQGTSALSLCLLLFVCLAIRPLGLTFRSHIFGVSLGLGITSITTLIEAAWVPSATGHKLYSPVYLIASFASLIALMVWLTYFALPEPERRMVLLPTTSNYFTWNNISEALGDEPGYVAVAGFTPDMLSAAEIEELSRSTHHDELGDGSDSDKHDDDDDQNGGGGGGTPAPHALMQAFLPS
ncbi:MAG TPA: hypothetical protein VGN16_08050 [Acidobacteriaceae bacterium]|jgi:hypothetical protein